MDASYAGNPCFTRARYGADSTSLSYALKKKKARITAWERRPFYANGRALDQEHDHALERSSLKQVEDHIMQLIAGSASLRKQRDLLISIPRDRSHHGCTDSK